LLLLNWYH